MTVLEDRYDDDLVVRMHAALATALRSGRPDPFGAPVTVAEIYQDLVPYRTVRTHLGFDMNADYEHTLLRLLAGEADLARLDPPEAREELRTELETPNPNVGLFRKFAACDVWVVPGGSAPEPGSETALHGGRAGEAGQRGGSDAGPEADDGASAREAAATRNEGEGGGADARDGWSVEIPAAEFFAGAEELREEEEAADDDSWDPRGVDWEHEDPHIGEDFGSVHESTLAAPPPEAGWTEEQAETELLLDDAVEVPVDELPGFQEEAAVPSASTTEIIDGGEMSVAGTLQTGSGPEAPLTEGGSCAFCDSSLPGKRTVRFCPYCGADQTTLPCAACGEAVEQGWNYCVACGSASPAAANG